MLIWLLVLLLVILAIGGGVAVSKFLFLILVVALILALVGVFNRSTVDRLSARRLRRSPSARRSLALAESSRRAQVSARRSGRRRRDGQSRPHTGQRAFSPRSSIIRFRFARYSITTPAVTVENAPTASGLIRLPAHAGGRPMANGYP